MSPVAKAPRRYFIELNGSMLLYVGAVFVHVYALNHHELAPGWRDALLVSPIPPIVLAFVAVWRFYRRIDEFQKLRLLETLAISGGVAAVFSISWEFLEDVGAPHLNLIWAWAVMGGSWIAVSVIYGWRDKAADGKLGGALMFWGTTFALVAVVTAGYAFAASKMGLPDSWGVLTLVATAVLLVRMAFTVFSKGATTC